MSVSRKKLWNDCAPNDKNWGSKQCSGVSRAMRPCLNELQKEYCVKKKFIALDLQWVTLISWFQMNRLGHSSPVMHKVEGKTHTILEKLKIMSGKSTLFWHFLWSIFRSPVLTSEFLSIKIIIPSYFIHVWLRVDLVFAFLVAIQW